jgi:hypothetical protein
VNKVAERRPNVAPGLLVQSAQPLIGIIFQEEGQKVVRYFAREEEADRATSSHGVDDAISLAGAWSDLDWDEMAEALERIGHESKPMPPIEL